MHEFSSCCTVCFNFLGSWICRGTPAPDRHRNDATGCDARLQHVPASATQPAPCLRHPRRPPRDDLPGKQVPRHIPQTPFPVATRHQEAEQEGLGLQRRWRPQVYLAETIWLSSRLYSRGPVQEEPGSVMSDCRIKLCSIDWECKCYTYVYRVKCTMCAYVDVYKFLCNFLWYLCMCTFLHVIETWYSWNQIMHVLQISWFYRLLLICYSFHSSSVVIRICLKMIELHIMSV